MRSIKKSVVTTFTKAQALPRFDMNKKVKRQTRFLTPVAWTLALPETFKRKVKIKKINMDSVKKEPYLLLCNHNAFYDFKVATRAIFPRRATYIVAIDGFINREGLMRHVGCFGKRKFINDTGLVKQIKYSLDTLKHVTVVYPEARYSLVGTTQFFPDSLGKLVKLTKAPVVTLITQGNHLSSPVWNLKPRKLKTEAVMTHLITKEEVESLSVDEINHRIKEAFVYDDYAWQKENGVKIAEKFRAEGLEKVLYKCPACRAEGKMKGTGAILKCHACAKEYLMGEDGALTAKTGTTEFSRIPAWHEWQRSEVVKEIKSGTYHFEHEVEIESLPNSTGFFNIGKGVLIHDQDGFRVNGVSHDGEEFSITKPAREQYSIHIEFNYFGRGDGISFSFPRDTYYFFSKEPTFLVTKAHFAVEELFKLLNSKQ